MIEAEDKKPCDNKLEKKIGKTTTLNSLIREFDSEGNVVMVNRNGVMKPKTKALIFGFELGWGGLNGVKAFPLSDWHTFKNQVIKPLIKQAEDCRKGKITRDEMVYNHLIWDTADLAYSACERYVLSTMGITSVDQDVNSYKRIEREFESVVLELSRQVDDKGVPLYSQSFITHDEVKQQKNLITREKEIFVSTSLDKRCQKILSRMVDVMMLLKTVDTGEGTPNRYAFFRTDGTFECGTRYKHIVPYCPLSVENIEKAIFDAIDKQCEEDGVLPTSSNIVVPSEETYDFDALMSEARALYGKFEEHGQSIHFLTSVEAVLGTGARLSEMKPSQGMALASVVALLKEKATELGLI